MQAPSSTLTSSSLWDFALLYYAQPQMAEICLHLQDNYSVNVCLLIAMRWCDERKQCLTAAEITKLSLHLQPWVNQVVEPLRELRRSLKQPIADFLQDELLGVIQAAIKQIELQAEKKLLQEIELWLQRDVKNQSDYAEKNLAIYLAGFGMNREVAAYLLSYP